MLASSLPTLTPFAALPRSSSVQLFITEPRYEYDSTVTSLWTFCC